MLIIAVALLVAVIGLFMYLTSAHPKWPTVGLIMFAVGLFYVLQGAGVLKL